MYLGLIQSFSWCGWWTVALCVDFIAHEESQKGGVQDIPSQACGPRPLYIFQFLFVLLLAATCCSRPSTKKTTISLLQPPIAVHRSNSQACVARICLTQRHESMLFCSVWSRCSFDQHGHMNIFACMTTDHLLSLKVCSVTSLITTNAKLHQLPRMPIAMTNHARSANGLQLLSIVCSEVRHSFWLTCMDTADHVCAYTVTELQSLLHKRNHFLYSW